jgi:hypothetical protein
MRPQKFVIRTTPLQGRHSRAEVERLQNFVIGTTNFVNETTNFVVRTADYKFLSLGLQTLLMRLQIFCYWTTNFVVRATNILLWDYKTENLSRGMI